MQAYYVPSTVLSTLYELAPVSSEQPQEGDTIICPFDKEGNRDYSK